MYSEQVATMCVKKVCSKLKLSVETRTAQAIPNLSHIADYHAAKCGSIHPPNEEVSCRY